MRKLILVLGLAQLLLLSACGGSGGGTVAGVGGGGGSGGGGGGGGGQIIANPAANVATIDVDLGPNQNAVDTPYVSVTICAPGTSNCQTINDIEVDTESFGLRIISGVLSPGIASALPQETDTASGQSLVECTQFVDGYSWGPVKTADIQIAGETATGIPVQVIGDPAYENTSPTEVPSNCSGIGPSENTVATFGANGIIGVGPFAEDCGQGCVTTTPSNPVYYLCPATWTSTSSCTATTVPLSAQVTNPVVRFPTDNNGVIVELPAVSPSGAASAAGSLVFGIGTEGNNGLAGATVLTADPSTGDISTTFNGKTLPNSYFDTGSNAYYFADSSIPTCTGNPAPGFFCPASELTFTATNSGETPSGVATGVTSQVTLYVDNANNLLNSNPTYSVFDNLGAPNSDTTSFDFGLPFFLGRNVYVAIDGQNSPGGVGPYFAY